jgi:hypothetical protein
MNLIQGQTKLYKIARLKQLFGRGQGWLYIGKDMIMLFIGIFVFEEVLKKWGLPIQPWFIYFYPVLPFAYVVACVVVGWIDEQKGIWKEESRYGTISEINPVGREMYDKLLEIHAELIKIEERK